MSVIYEGDDAPYYASKSHLAGKVCALSGHPVEPPFMVWRGLSDNDKAPFELYINADSLRRLHPHNGLSFLRDFIELLHASSLTNKDGTLIRTRTERDGERH